MDWRTMAGVSLATALMTGCVCTAVSNFEWIGHRPPRIDNPEAIACALLPRVNGPVKGRKIAFLTTAAKRAGIFGWRDLGYDGEVTGVVVRPPVKSNDQFLTVDMQVETLKIGGHDVSHYAAEKYLRAEICLREVNLKQDEWPAKDARVSMSGRMMWDGDRPHGFVEIHPRNRSDVH